MTILRKLSLSTGLSLTLGAFSAIPAFAQGTSTVDLCPRNVNPSGAFNILCPKNTPGLTDTFARIVSWGVTFLFIIATILALFFLIWGGIQWILSGGDKGKVENAQKMIVAAVIGLIVTFLAYFILNIVSSFFGFNLFNFSIPTINSIIDGTAQ